MPVTLIKSSWSSGSLVFHESTSKAPSVTYDVLTIGTDAVKVGNTSNDVDFQFYGSSISAIIDSAAATFSTVGIAHNINTSGSPLTYVAGTPAIAIYTTAAGSGTTSLEPFYLKSTVTGTSPVGGRARFHTYCNVVAGGWLNAVKGYLEFGTSGRVTGLGSAVCGEILLSAGTSPGSYAPIESELVCNTNGLTGAKTAMFFGAFSGTAVATLVTNGYLFYLVGMGTPADDTSACFHLQNHVTTTHALRVSIDGTDYDIPLVASTYSSN